MPWRTRGDLFARDDSLGEPAMNRGRGNLQNVRSAGNRYQFALWGFCRGLEACNVAVSTQASNLVCSEPLTADGFTSLTIENAGNDSVITPSG